jgi:hypothetical protein
MKVKELKDWINNLPDSYMEQDIVFSAFVEKEDEYSFSIGREDVPINATYTDNENKVVCLFEEPSLEKSLELLGYEDEEIEFFIEMMGQENKKD